jgi:hypothetical protein
MSIGRNDPCPCGNGKKYKKCCLGGPNDSAPEYMQNILADVLARIEGGQFSSLEEAQAELDKLMQAKNNELLDEFHGLSPAQIYRFLYFPFDSPDLVRFSNILNPPMDAPVVRLFSLLIDAIGEKGLKTTATGNLPREFCRESARAFEL